MTFALQWSFSVCISSFFFFAGSPSVGRYPQVEGLLSRYVSLLWHYTFFSSITPAG
jgi:hypothetical protein